MSVSAHDNRCARNGQANDAAAKIIADLLAENARMREVLEAAKAWYEQTRGPENGYGAPWLRDVEKNLHAALRTYESGEATDG